jgi:hypothetical protein
VVEHKSQMAAGHDVASPLRTASLLEPRPDLEVSLPFIAATLAAYLGEEEFLRGLRAALERHRHSTVSLQALTEDFGHTAERDLTEFMRVWFDRPGRFDYALHDVTEEGAIATLVIRNRGNIPAFADLPVRIVTPRGALLYHVTPGPRGGEFAVPVDGPVVEAILDPEFITPDTDRRNNAWPPRHEAPPGARQ